MSVAKFVTKTRDETEKGYQGQLTYYKDVPYSVCTCGWEVPKRGLGDISNNHQVAVLEHRIKHLEGKI